MQWKDGNVNVGERRLVPAGEKGGKVGVGKKRQDPALFAVEGAAYGIKRPASGEKRTGFSSQAQTWLVGGGQARCPASGEREKKKRGHRASRPEKEKRVRGANDAMYRVDVVRQEKRVGVLASGKKRKGGGRWDAHG